MEDIESSPAVAASRTEVCNPVVHTGDWVLYEIDTSDGLARLHFDHENWDIRVDVNDNATKETWAEIQRLAAKEGCAVLDVEECPAEILEEPLMRHHMHYLEGRECP